MTKHRTAELVVSVADLLPHPGTKKRVQREAILDGLAVTASRVPAASAVRLDVELQAVNDGIVAVGQVRSDWEGECRRCLTLAGGEVIADVQEIYERYPVDGETRPLGDGIVDLTELARDAVLLELPIAPLCADDCAGICPTCGVDRNEIDCDCQASETDPRWAPLSELRFED